MSARRLKSLKIVCAILALFVIVNDLAADAMDGPDTPYSLQSQQSETSPQTACPIDNGTAVTWDIVLVLAPPVSEAGSFFVADKQLLIGPPPAIDHPPQLADS